MDTAKPARTPTIIPQGFAVSIWMTLRSAKRMSAEAEREWGPPKDLGPDDDDEDD